VDDIPLTRTYHMTGIFFLGSCEIFWNLLAKLRCNCSIA